MAVGELRLLFGTLPRCARRAGRHSHKTSIFQISVPRLETCSFAKEGEKVLTEYRTYSSENPRELELVVDGNQLNSRYHTSSDISHNRNAQR